MVDADGLYLITEKPDLINHYENCILTPNRVEFERLYEKMTGVTSEEQRKQKDRGQLAQRLAEMLHVNIFMKGHQDIISSPNSQELIQHSIEGSPRRCGGQGDLLAGVLAVSYYWTIKNCNKIDWSSLNDEHPYNLSKLTTAQIAAYAASTIIRTSTQTTFSKLGRSMISADVLKEIGTTFNKIFEKQD